jgi:hypothetical protein
MFLGSLEKLALPNGAIIWRQLSELLWNSNVPEEAQAGGAEVEF